MAVYLRIKDVLNERGISIRKFAKDIDYNYESVRRIVNNDTPSYPRDFLDKTCRYLEKDVTDLIYFTFREYGEKEPPSPFI